MVLWPGMGLGRRRMEGFPRLFTVKEALAMLRERVGREVLEAEEVSLRMALGRVLAEDVKAPTDSPPYDRSAVDGYAVVAEDTFGASPSNPVELRLLGSAYPGAEPGELPGIGREEALEVMTGAPLPRGANAVVMVEDASKRGDVVEVMRPVHPYQNVSRRGEDFRAGELVVARGARLRPWHIGALASLNIARVRVVRRPRVAVLSTGDELVEVGSEPGPGKVVNSSKPMLSALLKEAGAEAVDLGVVGDDADLICERIVEGVRGADAAIVTGGTSVGVRDLVPEALERVGEVVVHGLMLRPGKPTGFGIVGGKPVFMLSGFPVAALVGFEVLVKPALELMMGCRFEPRPRVRGRLMRRVATPPGTRSYVRVRVVRDREGVCVEPLMLTGSGILSTLTKANGILIIPEELEGFDEGEEVEVELLQPPFEEA